eukprot:5726793-Pleurochrysis_carterae.AAC.1
MHPLFACKYADASLLAHGDACACVRKRVGRSCARARGIARTLSNWSSSGTSSQFGAGPASGMLRREAVKASASLCDGIKQRTFGAQTEAMRKGDT